MTYKKYEKYKDSNEEWIGIVPETWQVEPIREFYDYRSEKVSDKVYEPLSVTKQGILPQLEHAAKTDNNDNRKKVKKGDFVINSRSDRKGSCGVSPYEGSVSLIYHVLSSKDPSINAFAHHLFRSVMFAEEFYKWGHGIVDDLWSTRWDEMKKIKIPMPPKEERIHIGNYLNKKTYYINEQIRLNENLIQLLDEKKIALINQAVTKGLKLDVPMKDSGVKWIGNIPKHWNVEKIKNVSQVKPSNVDKKSKDNELPVLLCNYTDVYNNEFITMDLDFMKATASYDQIKKLSLDVDDIIITKDSESADDIAVPAIVTEELDNVVCGYHLAVINPNSNLIYPKFLFRSLESDRINKQFEIGANGVTRFGLGSYPINNAWVCLPPLNEQKEIAIYLDNETSKIFKTTKKITKHIELLKEYKISFIHNVVTGKIDVREEVI